MTLVERLRQQSTLTGLAAALFASSVILLFVALYNQTWRGLWMIAVALFAATVLCWIAAAQWEREPAESTAKHR